MLSWLATIEVAYYSVFAIIFHLHKNSGGAAAKTGGGGFSPLAL